MESLVRFLESSFVDQYLSNILEMHLERIICLGDVIVFKNNPQLVTLDLSLCGVTGRFPERALVTSLWTVFSKNGPWIFFR